MVYNIENTSAQMLCRLSSADKVLLSHYDKFL